MLAIAHTQTRSICLATAIDTARYLIHLAFWQDADDADDTLCNMRLQKLVYYAQAWHLAATGRPLFADRIEAWEHGPVVRSLYKQFKSHGLAIPASEGTVPSDLSTQDREFIKMVWDRYKDFSGTALRNRTHREKPYIDAWAKRDPGDHYPNIEITQEAMRDFFLPRYVELLKREDPRVDLAKWKASADSIAAGRVSSPGELRRAFQLKRTGLGS